MLERWRIPLSEFDQALKKHRTDEELFAWFTERVRPEDVRSANEWLVRDRIENLDRQDAEEVVPAERPSWDR